MFLNWKKHSERWEQKFEKKRKYKSKVCVCGEQVLRGVLGALMTWCHQNKSEFRRNIDMFESETFRQTLEKMVHKRHENNYTLRLYLKNMAGLGCIKVKTLQVSHTDATKF